MKNRNRGGRQGGFSLIEVLVVMAIVVVVSAAIMSQMEQAQQRAGTEQARLDRMQMARDFVDQFVRDLNLAGYPNQRMVDSSSAAFAPALANPRINDARLAAGIVRIGANEIWFEGDVDGDGKVESVVYKVNGSGTCANCLQRSQTAKVNGNPLTAQSQVWGTQVNDVSNAQVFSAYKADGTPISLATTLDLSNAAQAQTIASIKTVQINLVVMNNNIVDLKTRLPIEIVVQSEGIVQNCSMVATGQPQSC